MIRLKHRLLLSCALLIALILTLLISAVNFFSVKMFEGFVKKAIAEKNADIARAVAELYDHRTGAFDIPALEAVGMLFVHDGFVIDVEDADGTLIWDARSMNMRHCVAALDLISERMRRRYGGTGELQSAAYPLDAHGKSIGAVNIASVGPFFYTEAESAFLTALNRLLFGAAALFIFLGALASLALASALSRPIRAASGAARKIAAFYRSGAPRGELKIELDEQQRTCELAELSRSINELNRELAESERRQKQLVSDVAHELRTPLTTLRGTLEAIHDGVWEATRERLAFCFDEVCRLSKLTGDMTLLNGVEWENVVLRPRAFDMEELVRSVAGQFQAAAREKGLRITLETCSAPVYADYDRIKQALINVASNALAYTDAGSVSWTLRRRGTRFELDVRDTGIGIAAEELPRIFERFYRTDKSRGRRRGGAGIGLTICAAILRAHGWTISAQSEAGAGSVFTIRGALAN
jgi:signal transduction histidine kinase